MPFSTASRPSFLPSNKLKWPSVSTKPAAKRTQIRLMKCCGLAFSFLSFIIPPKIHIPRLKLSNSPAEKLKEYTCAGKADLKA
ncbi:MAG: hypothetical protein Q8N85_06180 [Candidatus Omnitrophota bacterium]|nr:hypothetical protein [Candidatus Omnitrophota bacterium]